jgi:hypothetical protein
MIICTLGRYPSVYAASILVHPKYFLRSLRITRRRLREYVEPTVRAVRKVWRKYFKPDSSVSSATS